MNKDTTDTMEDTASLGNWMYSTEKQFMTAKPNVSGVHFEPNSNPWTDLDNDGR